MAEKRKRAARRPRPTKPAGPANTALKAAQRKLREAEARTRELLDNAEAELRESESKFRAVVETAASAIFIVAHDKLCYVNPATESITGYTEKELLGRNFWELVHPEFRELIRKRGRARQRGDAAPPRYEFKILTKNGEERWMGYSAGTILYKGGPAILGTAFDITERKRVEQDLQVQKAYLEQLFDSAPEAIALATNDSIVVRVNHEFERIFGYRAEEVCGKKMDLIVPAERRKEMVFLREALERGQKVNVETKRRRKDGTLVDVSLLGTPVRGAGGQLAIYLIYRDITERKQAEEALRESEAKFRAVAETAAIAIYIHDGERFLYLNPASERISGYTRGELMGLSPWKLVHPQFEEDMRQRAAARRRGEDIPTRYEFKLLSKSGEVRWLDFSAGVIQFEGKTAILASAVDITERKRAEALQSALYRIADKASSAAELEDLFAAIHAIVAELMYARNFYIALYDPATELLSFPYFVDEEDQPDPPRPLGRGLTEYILRTGEPLLADPDRFNDLVRRGEVALIGAPSLDWLGVPLKQGDRTFGVLVVQSYTQSVRYGEKEKEILTFVSQHVASAILRKRSQEELRRSEARYRSLVQSAVYGIYRSSVEGRFLDVNPALVSMLGYESAEDLMQVNMAAVYADPEERARLIREYERRDRVEGARVRWKRKDDTVIDVRISGRTVRDRRRVLQGFEMIVEDVTERSALEEQLRQSQKMEAVGRLAGGVAHDFNNLLTVIKGYGELMLEELKPSDPMRAEVQEVQKAADRAAALTRQLLAFSRRQVMAPKVIDLNEVVANMDKLLRRLLGEDIDLFTALDPYLGPVKADPGQIEQVVMNLAVNSRDAMPQGGKLTIETSNVSLDEGYAREHVTVKPGEYVMLAVSDTGEGMDAETCSKVFEPFFTTKEQGKGTGLGLSTVYGIVKQSGGYIWVYSEPGRGTTFKVYLPKVSEAAERIDAPERDTTAPRGNETILLVEDEDGVRALIRQVLHKNGYTVLQAAHGGEALLLCERHHGAIDLLLTDVVLSQMTGRELAQRLAPLRPKMKVLYMSGYTDEAILHHGMLSPGSAFLQKPFTTDALTRKIREVLDFGEKAKAAKS